MAEDRIGTAIIRRLETYGVDTVFGIPGVHTIELYRGLAGSPIRAVTPRHEQGAAFMADGYARVSGRPGVCLLITGPGVLNAATPIAQAWHDSVPLVVLASTTATGALGRGRGALHDVPDQAALVASLTKLSSTAVDPASVLPQLDAAWVAATSGRPRPVHVAVPTDVLAAPAATRPSPPAGPSALVPDPAVVAAATALLAEASRPVLLVGGGGAGAGDAVRTFAERVGAPVVTTGNARGVLPEDHPLALGTTLPFSPVQSLVSAADVVVAVGTELSEVDVLYSGSSLALDGQVIRVDVDPGQLNAYVRASVGIVGDAAIVLAALASRPTPTAAEGAADRVKAARAAIEWSAQTESHRPWLDAIDAALPRDRIVALDSTQLAYSALHYLPAYSPRSFLAPYGLGTLGPALPMAIGAALAAPSRPVAALVGDGGLLFTLPELATARDLGLALPVVVWDNGGYGEIRDAFDRAGAQRVGTETTAHDLVAIARGFGCYAMRVASPDDLSDRLAAALLADRPTVLVIKAPR